MEANFNIPCIRNKKRDVTVGIKSYTTMKSKNNNLHFERTSYNLPEALFKKQAHISDTNILNGYERRLNDGLLIMHKQMNGNERGCSAITY